MPFPGSKAVSINRKTPAAPTPSSWWEATWLCIQNRAWTPR